MTELRNADDSDAFARNDLLDQLVAFCDGDERVRGGFSELPVDVLRRCVAAAADGQARRAWIARRREERAAVEASPRDAA